MLSRSSLRFRGSGLGGRELGEGSGGGAEGGACRCGRGMGVGWVSLCGGEL